MDSIDNRRVSVVLTEAAMTKINAIIEQEEHDDIAGLRISITGRNATAFEYG